MNFMECFSCDSNYSYATRDYTQFMLSEKLPTDKPQHMANNFPLKTLF